MPPGEGAFAVDGLTDGTYLCSAEQLKATTMPSKKPRLALTIPDDLAQVLAEFREATGVSPASFVTGMLIEAMPMIRNVTRAALVAKSDKAQAFDVLSSTLAEALHDGAGLQMEILDETHKVRRARHDLAKNTTKENDE